jgi:hypothetical protein
MVADSASAPEKSKIIEIAIKNSLFILIDFITEPGFLKTWVLRLPSSIILTNISVKGNNGIACTNEEFFP